ncbi:MAG: LolA family protein [Bacteroidota bacterium]
MIRSIIIAVLLIFSWSLNAQKDPAAKTILDKFSDAALSVPAIHLKFSLTVHDKIEETTQESDGQVIIKDNMYKLELPDNIIWYDGSSTWTLAPEVKEVTVTIPDPDENTFFTSPSSLFDMYKEDFKYRLLEESPERNVIDLYPEDPSNTDFSIIRLVIDEDGRLTSAEYRRKDGIDLYVDIIEYNHDKSYPDSYFTFDSTDYPDVDVIDMR